MKTEFVVVVVLGLATIVYSQNPCTTPNGESAQCISIYQCQVFIDALVTRTNETVRFMRASQCGYKKDPMVCCGSVTTFQQSTSSQKPPTLHVNMNLLPSRYMCNMVEERIIGGYESAIDAFPWTVLLEYRKNGTSRGFHCGGVLINERYVLTAAHCSVGDITRTIGELYRIRLGEYNITSAIDCIGMYGFEDCADPPLDIDVDEIIAHKNFLNNTNKLDDIALVRLARPVKYTDFIKPICLPLNVEGSKPGERLTVAGWGYTDNNKGAEVKRRMQLQETDKDQCADISRSHFNLEVTEKQLCAGAQSQREFCSGDSGGALMRRSPVRHEWLVEGIASYGTACGTDGVPGVYTRISEYVEWILDNIKP